MKVVSITCATLLLSTSIYAAGVMIVAHRGAPMEAPENTLPAFKLAWKQGADAIEGDFHLTKDDQIVCIHDSNTKRISATNLVVRNSTLDELRKLDVGVRHGEIFKGTVIPTIAEVFSTIPDQKTIYIEIKCGTEIIPALLREIKKSGLKKEQIIVISFDEQVIKELKAKAPEFKALWLHKIKEKESGESSPLKTVLTTLTQIKADGICSATKNVDVAYVKSIIENGFEFHVWTVDDITTARRFKEWGAKAIISNVHSYIRSNLVEQNATLDAEKPRK